MRADDVLEHADDVCFEFFDVRAVENGASDPDHAGTDLGDRHLRRLAGQKGGREHRHPDEWREDSESRPEKSHGITFNYSAEVLTGQGEMGDRIDSGCGGLILFRLPVTNRQWFSLGLDPAIPASVSAWWWYRGSTEEASALA
jgi:hypothetical protein